MQYGMHTKHSCDTQKTCTKPVHIRTVPVHFFVQRHKYNSDMAVIDWLTE